MSDIHPLRSDTPKKYLFYGPPGTGKTRTAIAYLLKLLKRKSKARALWIDIDHKLEEDEGLSEEVRAAIDIWTPPTRILPGEIGIARMAIEKKPNTQDYVPKDPRGYIETVNFLNELDRRVNKGDYPWDLTVCDTITTVVEHLIPLICSHHNSATMSTPMWGVFGANMAMFRSAFLSLPGHRILIAHTRYVKNKEGEILSICPSVPGQTGENMGKDYNEMYYFQGRERFDGPYTAIVNASRLYQARSAKAFQDAKGAQMQVVPLEMVVERM